MPCCRSRSCSSGVSNRGNCPTAVPCTAVPLRPRAASGCFGRHGCATLHGLLAPDECRALAALYDDDAHFRSRIVMGRHGFGRGEYKYFSYPLPDLIAELRPVLYARLQSIANRWNEAMGIDIRYPASHAAFLKRCHDAGQTRPTPLLLQYEAGDFN